MSFASSIATVYYGTFIHSASLKQLEFNEQALLFVDSEGNIAKVLRDVQHQQLEDALDGVDPTKVVHLNEDQFIIPGFVDTHIHAPQYAYCGNGQDLPLLEWLDRLTFPHEQKFSNPEYALQIYQKAVSRSLKNGTTSASWFATIHLEGTQVLARVIQELGQRAFVGKVNMNQNAPAYLTETTLSSVEDTRKFIEYVHQLNKNRPEAARPGLLTPIITPRFAISCTSELLMALGNLAKEYQLPIQSHLCETPAEIAWTLSLFPQSSNYTSIYADHGLLNHQTIMAHCVHMTRPELELLQTQGTGIAHCANSNFNIKSGMANIRQMLDMNLKVGLGTDVAGGYAPSILEALRCSRTCSVARQQETSLTVPELFYLATRGGAEVMGLEGKVGRVEVGMAFDAILVNVGVENSGVDVFEHDTIETRFEKYLFVGDDRNHEKVFVQGREIHL